MKTIQHYIVPSLMVLFTLLVSLWMMMARVSGQPFKPYYMTREDIVEFHPEIDGYTVQLHPYVKTVTEANIAAYSLIPALFAEQGADNVNPLQGAITNNHQPSTINHSSPPSRLLVRLVHGYNMPMCMKMKYYTVEKIQDHQVRPVSDPKLRSAFTDINPQASTINHSFPPDSHQPLPINHSPIPSIPPDYPIPVQLWKLTSSAGTVSCWASTMIQSGDFEPTTEDICSMTFPRVNTPDDPNWVPRGFTKADLRHPVAAVQRWFRGRWDGARWDVLTFLRLRQPAWPSDELFSYLTIIDDFPSGEIRAADVRLLLEVHEAMLKEMQGWRTSGGGMKRDERGGER